MCVPLAARTEATASRFTSEFSPREILGRVAKFNGLSKDDAHLLANWLKKRGQNIVSVVDKTEDSAVVWIK
jgi:hypothetical protein